MHFSSGAPTNVARTSEARSTRFWGRARLRAESGVSKPKGALTQGEARNELGWPSGIGSWVASGAARVRTRRRSLRRVPLLARCYPSIPKISGVPTKLARNGVSTTLWGRARLRAESGVSKPNGALTQGEARNELGWPSGIEPEIKAPQASVLPLHHGHRSLSRWHSTQCWSRRQRVHSPLTLRAPSGRVHRYSKQPTPAR